MLSSLGTHPAGLYLYVLQFSAGARSRISVATFSTSVFCPAIGFVRGHRSLEKSA